MNTAIQYVDICMKKTDWIQTITTVDQDDPLIL